MKGVVSVFPMLMLLLKRLRVLFLLLVMMVPAGFVRGKDPMVRVATFVKEDLKALSILECSAEDYRRNKDWDPAKSEASMTMREMIARGRSLVKTGTGARLEFDRLWYSMGGDDAGDGGRREGPWYVTLVFREVGVKGKDEKPGEGKMMERQVWLLADGTALSERAEVVSVGRGEDPFARPGGKRKDADQGKTR